MRTVSDLRFVIVGSGASGTGYVHKLLNNCGIPTGHEAVFNPFQGHHGPIRDDLVGDSSYMAVPYLERGVASGATVVHVVRDTMSVLRSLVGRKFMVGGPPGTEVYDEWGRTNLPQIKPLLHKPLTAAIFYYLRWNERCERLASYRVRVEDLSDALCVKDLLGVLRCDASDEAIDEAIVATPTNYNSRTRGKVEAIEVLCDTFGRDVALMADRYGYDL